VPRGRSSVAIWEYFDFLETSGYVVEYQRSFSGDDQIRTSLRIDVPAAWQDLFHPWDNRNYGGYGISSVIRQRFQALGFRAESTSRFNALYVLLDHPGVDIRLARYRNEFLPHLALRGGDRSGPFLARLGAVTARGWTLEEFYADFFAWRDRIVIADPNRLMDEFCTWASQNYGP
jgi:hypothetical protein